MTGTLTGAPLLVMVTVPLVSVAVYWPAIWAVAQAAWRASACAEVTSVSWSSGALLAYQALYWDSMVLIRDKMVYRSPGRSRRSVAGPIRLDWCA